MILTLKTFAVNKDNDYEKMASRVGQLRIFLNHLLAGDLPNQDYTQKDLAGFCRSLIDAQRGAEEGLTDGSWSVSPAPAELDEDDRIDYHFFPTYLALSLLVSSGSRFPALCQIPGYHEALERGFGFAVSENLQGYGFNSFFQEVEAVLILGAGGCARWLKDHPSCCPALLARLKELKADYQNRLDEERTLVDSGADYRGEYTLACTYLSCLD